MKTSNRKYLFPFLSSYRLKITQLKMTNSVQMLPYIKKYKLGVYALALDE